MIYDKLQGLLHLQNQYKLHLQKMLFMLINITEK